MFGEVGIGCLKYCYQASMELADPLSSHHFGRRKDTAAQDRKVFCDGKDGAFTTLDSP